MEYVIVESSRKGSNRTYTGNTWNRARLGIPPEDTVYDDLEQAEKLAQKLSEHNPVGFIVEKYISINQMNFDKPFYHLKVYSFF